MRKTPINISNTDKYYNMLIDISQEFGTPLYVYDIKIVQRQLEKLRGFLPDYVELFYSVKANPNLDIIRFFQSRGAAFEVTSVGELNRVKQCCKQKMCKTLFVGPGKTSKDIEYALNNQVDWLVVESESELEKVQKKCLDVSFKGNIAIRVNPGKGFGQVCMSGHNQFGIDQKSAINLLNKQNKEKGVIPKGLHYYLGTGILINCDLIKNLQLVLSSAEQIIDESNLECEFLDIGGGIGIPYYHGDKEFDLDGIKMEFSSLLSDFRKKHPEIKYFAFESGRYLVGTSGFFLSKVVNTKMVWNENYAILDGGSNVFAFDCKNGFRPLMMDLLDKKTERKQQYITICGPLCTSMDCLANNVLFPKLKNDDIIAFFNAGAYGFSASPGKFLSHGFPKEIVLNY